MSHRSSTSLNARVTAALCVFACMAAACGRAHSRADAARGASDAVASLRDAAHDDTPTDAGPATNANASDGAADASTDAPRVQRVTITATGDIVLNARINEIAVSHRLEGRLGWVLAPVAPLLGARAIAFANLETPLVSNPRSSTPGRPASLGAPVDFARDLARIGFDVLQVANNHAYDQTADGLYETLQAVRAAGMVAVGAGVGDDEAFGAQTVEREGIRVAFLAFTVRTNDGPARNTHDIRIARLVDEARALQAITAARNGHDVVVVGVHWSRDRVAPVDEDQRALAERMITAGADFVAGTGPGLLQRVERVTTPRGQGVVAYSLGNFVSPHGAGYRVGMAPAQVRANLFANDPATREGVLLHVTFDLSDESQLRVSSVIANAIWVSHVEEELRVIPMRGADERIRTDRLRAIAQTLGPAVRVRP